MYKLLTATLVLFPALLLAGLTPADTAAADESAEGPIKVTLAEAAAEFPSGIRFRVRAESDSPITSVAVRLRSQARSWGVYEHLDHSGGKVVDARLFWRAGFGTGYIPPGALLHVSFEIEDSAGNLHETGFKDFVYQDPRFEWDEVTSGPVTVAYHGPVRRRAEDILDTIVQTLDIMAPILGSGTSVPIRATLYNNYGEMLVALPPWTRQIGHEIIAEGQAFADFNTLLILGSGRQALGTAGHEAVHILTHQAGDGFVSRLPAWLDEGLAEFGNPQPGYLYDIALEFAIETGTLLPVLYMQGGSLTSEEIIIFYGQAKSIVSYMVFTYGPEKIRRLLSELKSDVSMDEALTAVYGFSVEDLDNSWRRFVGAPEYQAPEVDVSRPASQPLPALDMYTLDTRPVAPESDTTPDDLTSAVTQDAELSGEEGLVASPEGGGCNARPNGAGAMMDVSAAVFAAWFLAFAVLRLRRRTLC